MASSRHGLTSKTTLRRSRLHQDRLPLRNFPPRSQNLPLVAEQGLAAGSQDWRTPNILRPRGSQGRARPSFQNQRRRSPLKTQQPTNREWKAGRCKMSDKDLYGLYHNLFGGRLKKSHHDEKASPHPHLSPPIFSRRRQTGNLSCFADRSRRSRRLLFPAASVAHKSPTSRRRFYKAGGH